VAVFNRNIWVHPFHEEDPKGLIDIEGLTVADQAKIMGGNLAAIMKIAA
jgi:hypothetical protein